MIFYEQKIHDKEMKYSGFWPALFDCREGALCPGAGRPGNYRPAKLRKATFAARQSKDYYWPLKLVSIRFRSLESALIRRSISDDRDHASR